MEVIPFENEAAADCLAGAFTAHAGRDGSLESGDTEEAFFGLALAGDPPPRMTGDRRTDRRLRLRASLMGHGTRVVTAHANRGAANIGAATSAVPPRSRG